jgi:hypothetical protein
MKKNSEVLEKIKIVKIKGETFTFDISKYDIRSHIALESEKQRLAGGQYFQMATTYFTNTLSAVNLIDMICVFRIFAPEIENCTTSKDFEKLSLLESKELYDIYIKNIALWYKQWMQIFEKPFETEDATETK